MLSSVNRKHEKTLSGQLPEMTDDEQSLCAELSRHVRVLCTAIGERNYLCPGSLQKAAAYIEAEFATFGFAVERQPYTARDMTFYNLIAEKRGSSRPEKIILIGAHYDSFAGTVGADDNASGVAALLALASRCSRAQHDCTLRFAAFVNEEPPFFWTRDMGSHVYARRCRNRGDRIVAMLSLECVGYYDAGENSQRYLFPLGLFYPRQGDFIAFVSNLASRSLLRRCLTMFKAQTRFPAHGAALPGWVPGVFWSDHWPFWKSGYPALMVTDTALFRNPHYHTALDLPETLDLARAARVMAGLQTVIAALAAAR